MNVYSQKCYNSIDDLYGGNKIRARKSKKDKSKVKEEAFRSTHTVFVHEGIEYYVTAEKEIIEVPSSFE